jgi:hypothetical protein
MGGLLPGRQEVEALPEVDWDRFIRRMRPSPLETKEAKPKKQKPGSGTSDLDSTQVKQENSTSAEEKEVASTIDEQSLSGHLIKEEKGEQQELFQPGNIKSEDSPSQDAKEVELIDGPQPGDIIRGRLYTDTKPTTFNKLWTPEEQRRLEELLIEHPEEEVAAHRWAKIARALGNRNPRQVASRCQKYFLKLAMSGLPVPGKPPNVENYLNRKRNRRKKLADGHESQAPERNIEEADYYTPPPVYMSDDEEEVDPLDPTVAEVETKKRKVNERVVKKVDKQNSIHYGFKCAGCQMEPITGSLWQCTDCARGGTEVGSHFCGNCCKAHTQETAHSMQRIKTTTHWDRDYQLYSDASGTSYLDPSYG